MYTSCFVLHVPRVPMMRSEPSLANSKHGTFLLLTCSEREADCALYCTTLLRAVLSDIVMYHTVGYCTAQQHHIAFHRTALWHHQM